MDSSPAQPTPRIAVIVPAYGVAHLLHEALDSLQAQSFTDWEAIVIDDGAPDDAAAAVAPYLHDSRIRFLQTDNGGVSTARNRAIAASRAPLIALLDGDDLFRPDYLAAMVAAMEADPEACIATCNARVFGAVARESEVVRAGQNRTATGSLTDLLSGRFNIYIGSTFLRAGFDAIGGFDPGMTHSEDLDLWVRLLLNGGHARYVDAVLCDYRVRGVSASRHLLKIIRGNMRVYDKIVAARPGSEEARLASALRAREEERGEVEEAVAAVIAGDTGKGLQALRSHRNTMRKPVWSFAFALWRVFPRLAPPMLAWRQKRHATTMTPSPEFRAG
ncbi:glycosyltransferase family A protein [Sphingopyxis sp.]|uniref:glycosyltransferase family A protein n=1 Tax=Sphingopyxis sp. TaxID=1908224 RepID=UPI003BAAB92D